MRIIFMGTPDYAEHILERLIEEKNMDVVAVYTQPDKPVGRKKILTAPSVKLLADKNSIKVYQPIKLRSEDVIDELLKIECDYIVVAAYGQILPREILNHAPCINLHASILPKYRGASPIQQVLLNGETQTGVTAMLMDEGLDTGEILKISKLDINEDIMVEELFDNLTKIATDLSVDILKNYDSITPYKQDEKLATHCKKISRADGEVVFDNAKALYNKYRAFTPWPGVYLKSGLKLKRMKLEDKVSKHRAGEILSLDSDSIVVGCESGAIRIFRVQPSSKKEMGVISYINGKRLGIEDIIS